ncbi:DUF1189 domain-containing protein [Salipaludibacillus agaradhaerens]|uniref:DUF1189 domain-containing protein n=1 Tax=Salipaludibacillus agaradhaerens TaxID=76935 RepID=UPI002151F136|nr:DUF1189 domain-containing protein [Salipaludibacillus agaradhaerens]MCR6106358.1 DUF1189 domain-containing protein [Salipaludibacillus agaradhaerens]MCR6118391.1 DUF1189 domain-containing protein [Salipaludibacillus agaradhaerens]UJW57497.1 DUF1189 domain-containing protein [Bacillus sp. A116_S68]
MNIFKQFIKSLISPQAIASFRFQKIGKAILYVFFLMLIACIPLAFQIGSGLNALFNTVHTYVEELPSFYVEDGLLASDELNEPYISETDHGFIIIDPTGDLNPADISDYDIAYALLERSAVITVAGDPEVMGYQEIGVPFSSDQLLSMVETVNNLLPLIIFLIVLVVYLVGTGVKFIVILLLSLIMLLMKSSMANQLSYKQCWILSVYTATLPTIILVLFGTLNLLGMPLLFILYWIIAVIIITYVLKSIPKPKDPITE